MIEKAKDPLAFKTKTRGRFPREYQTNAGVWIKDRSWIGKANPALANEDRRLENQDKDMLEKRKKQKIL